MTREKLLIVDDRKEILESMAIVLQDEFTVFTALSAEDAVEILRRESVRIIISDHRMPGQDGLSFLAESRETHPETIRILMTAESDLDLLARSLQEGIIHRHIPKPCRLPELLKILAEYAEPGGSDD